MNFPLAARIYNLTSPYGWDEPECARRNHPTRLGETHYRQGADGLCSSVRFYCPCGRYAHVENPEGQELLPKMWQPKDEGDL